MSLATSSAKAFPFSYSHSLQLPCHIQRLLICRIVPVFSVVGLGLECGRLGSSGFNVFFFSLLLSIFLGSLSSILFRCFSLFLLIVLLHGYEAMMFMRDEEKLKEAIAFPGFSSF